MRYMYKLQCLNHFIWGICIKYIQGRAWLCIWAYCKL